MLVFDYSIHEFITRFEAHPAFPLLRSSKSSFLAELLPHCMYCLASHISVERSHAMFCANNSSRAHAQQWNATDIAIRLYQRRALLCRGALFDLLVSRLLRVVKNKCGLRHPLNLAKHILSQRHFLGSKKRSFPESFRGWTSFVRGAALQRRSPEMESGGASSTRALARASFGHSD
jgi:hypothetical protein